MHQWQTLQCTPLGSDIPAWSKASGYDLKTTIRVEEVADNYITVSSNGTEYPRRISRNEVEMVASLWADYCAGRYPRYRLRDQSKNSTYIIALLRWIDVERGTVS
jgi:hypothetical protein